MQLKIICNYGDGGMTLPREGLQTLQENGFRVTPQRRTVLEVLAASGSNLSAEAIYERAKQINARISLTTVYRTLAVLEQNRLVEQRYISPDHERSHFVLTGMSPRFHFHCLACGKGVEFGSTDAIAALLDSLDELEPEASSRRVCVCIEGYCQSCAQGRETS